MSVENQTVKFEIELNKSDLIDKLIWLKDGIEIDFKLLRDKYEIKANGNKYTLTLNNVKFADEGTYSVNIRHTDINSSANLSVTGILLFICIHVKKLDKL